MLRLLTRPVDEPDERKCRHRLDDVRLGLDTAGLQPDEGERDCAREHDSTLRRNV